MNFHFTTRFLKGSIIALFLCIAAFGNSNAQDIQSLVSLQANGNWKSAEDANRILLERITNMNDQLPSFPEGSQPYDNTLRRVAYYKAILDAVEDGNTLPLAMENAMTAAATLGFTKEETYTPKVLLRAIYEETKVMLSN